MQYFDIMICCDRCVIVHLLDDIIFVSVLLHDFAIFLDTGMFWTAPEILRDPRLNTVTSHQKADVYSFAVTIYEILERRQPYDTELNTPEGGIFYPFSISLVVSKYMYV